MVSISDTHCDGGILFERCHDVSIILCMILYIFTFEICTRFYLLKTSYHSEMEVTQCIQLIFSLDSTLIETHNQYQYGSI